MGLPAYTPEPLETALRAKVHELFGDSARLAQYVDDGEPVLEIRTVLGLEEADRRLGQVYDWVVEEYPYDKTIVGLLHVHSF